MVNNGLSQYGRVLSGELSRPSPGKKYHIKKYHNVLFNPVDESFELEGPRTRGKHEWIRVKHIVGDYARFMDIIRGLERSGVDVGKASSNLEKLRANLLVNNILPVYVIKDFESYEDGVKLFIRLNTGGVRVKGPEVYLAVLAMLRRKDVANDIWSFVRAMKEDDWDLTYQS